MELKETIVFINYIKHLAIFPHFLNFPGSRYLTVDLFFVSLICINSVVYAADPRLEWKTTESEHFTIHYAEGFAELAQKTANAAERAHQKLHGKINWIPTEKTHLVISDQTDQANGYATPLPYNRSVLFMAPPDSASGLEDFDDWLETLITHEYTHTLHLDKAAGAPKFLRKLFGRHFLLFPNAYQPNWITEGLGTYYETRLVPGTGRGQSTLFKMMMAVEVNNGLKPVSQVNLPIRSWPMGTVAYLYGVHFIQFIEETYGEQAINLLIQNYSNNIIPFMINSNARQVFGKDIDALWIEFSSWLDIRYADNTTTNQPSVDGMKLTESGYTTGSVEPGLNGQIYYIENSAFKHAALISINDTKQKKLAEVHNGALLNTHPLSGILITQLEFCDEYNLNRDIYYIARVESDGEDDVKRLSTCGRYRSASWTPDGQNIVAVKTDKAVSQLVLLNKQAEFIKLLWQGNATDVVTQLNWSPADNKMIAAVFRKGRGWNIEEFDLHTQQWSAITNDHFIDMYPSYSDQGKSILFSSERNGQYQIYRYNKANQQLQQITQVSAGAFDASQTDSMSPLYYAGYNANGYDIYKLEQTDIISTSVLSSALQAEKQLEENDAANVNLTEAKDYSALSTLAPRWWFPSVLVTEDRSEIGLSTSAMDALETHSYFLNMVVDVSNQWLVGNVSYSYANSFVMGYQRSTDILKDSNGQFALARNNDDIYMSLAANYPGVENSVSYRLGLLLSESTDAEIAKNIQPLPDVKDNLLGGAVLFSNEKNYIRSVSKSDGRNIRLIGETNEAIESDFSGEIYTLDWREYISLGQQNVLAVRLVQGWGTDQPQQFRLGGEDNDYALLDIINSQGEALFGKREYSLRGYAEGLPQLSGRRMQLATLEWRFPGSLIERGWMSPPLGVIQWSGNVFTETGAAYNDETAAEFYSSVGLEVEADINLFYGLTTRMRLGMAHGLDENIGEDRFYFMLGSSF